GVTMLSWLEVLEKDFDKSFVDLDLLLGQIDPDQFELTVDGRNKMTFLSSAFAQLSQKAQAIFQSNAKYEAQLISLRADICDERAAKCALEKELHNQLVRLHPDQDGANSDNQPIDGDKNKSKLALEIEQSRQSAYRESRLRAEVELLRKENVDLRYHIDYLQSELYAARLATKYLDKELAGRVQQLQLLGRDMKGAQHEALWNQLEAEINLHRHKTVVKTCKMRNQSSDKPVQSPTPVKVPKHQKRRGIGQIRTVQIFKDSSEGLGISITGGREYGVPILISEIHKQTPAERCKGLYIGDAILSVNGMSLKHSSHVEAVHILSKADGEILLEVVYVTPDDSSEDDGVSGDSE
ncbi:uncharacterized protein TRIADDRAFT_13274, partial [Trichoplax adhaerens]